MRLVITALQHETGEELEVQLDREVGEGWTVVVGPYEADLLLNGSKIGKVTVDLELKFLPSA